MLMVGGIPEMDNFHDKQIHLVLNKRKGFIKLALRNGASLVPTFVFGETKLYQQSSILSVTTDLPALTQFARFSKYWTGEHHIEEMMYHENCSRYELLQCLDKFSSILVKHEHEDPVITQYWSRVVQ